MTSEPAIAAHRCDALQNNMTAQTDITPEALHLALRLTHPPCAQSRSMGPNRRWYQSQACKRGELRADAQAAIKINTVVGKPGTNTPMTPKARHPTANAQSRARTTGLAICICGGGGILLSGVEKRGMVCKARKRRLRCAVACRLPSQYWRAYHCADSAAGQKNNAESLSRRCATGYVSCITAPAVAVRHFHRSGTTSMVAPQFVSRV